MDGARTVFITGASIPLHAGGAAAINAASAEVRTAVLEWMQVK